MKTITKTKHLFKMHLMLLLLALLALNSAIVAQTKVAITGTVIDSEKMPIIGATIIVKGTTTGTVTDLDGKFSIDANIGETLVFSYIGFVNEEHVIADNQPVNITMVPDLVGLDEVVVVGYGTMRKKDLTGSIASVSSEELHKGVVTSTEQVLQGKVAGLTIIRGSGDPTSGATMRLRGGSSLLASSTPLVVVDGIPGVDINTVAPSEIASVDVLKDASASAIYGSRGANGVIMITTNRPDKGSRVEYNGYVAVGKQVKYLDMLTADEWRAKVEEMELTKAVDFGSNTDWQKEITQNANTQSHNLSFYGNNDNGGYKASLMYLNSEGIVRTTELERFGGSVNAFTYKFDKRLKLEVGAHSTYDKYTPMNNFVWERAYTVNPTAPVKDSLGEYFQVDVQNSQNPVEVLINRQDHQTRKRVLGYAKAEIELIKDLKAVLNGSYEYNSHQGRYFLPSYSFLGSTDHGYASRSLNDMNVKQVETYLSYDKELGNHRMNIMAGYSYEDRVFEGFNGQNRNFDTDLFTYNNLGAGLQLQAGDVDSYKSRSNLISFYGRGHYTFNNRYNLTATVRRDGSSKFGKNNKWGLFPSVGLGWKISDEDFMQFASGWMNNMKIRAGWGVAGNQDAVEPYWTFFSYAVDATQKYYDPISQTWKYSYMPNQNQNDDLKWETTTQTNIGFDLTLIDKLSLTFDWYKKYTEDVLFDYFVPMPPNLVEKTRLNFGEISNKGWDLAVGYKVLSEGDLTWNIDLTFAQNKQVIEKLNDELNTEAVPSGSLHGLPGMSNQFSQTIREGYAVGTFWGQKATLDEEGKFLNVNGDPFRVADDSLKTDLGNAQPKFTLGFNTSLTYKNFDLSIATYGMFGQKVLNATKMALTSQKRFPDQNVPNSMFEDSITASPTYCNYWIESGSFLRLQSVTLGYTFDLKDYGIDKLRLYVTGENLFIITKYSGLDPEIKIEDYDSEYGRVTGLGNPGIDRFDVYPRPRIFTVGVNVAF